MKFLKSTDPNKMARLLCLFPWEPRDPSCWALFLSPPPQAHMPTNDSQSRCFSWTRWYFSIQIKNKQKQNKIKHLPTFLKRSHITQSQVTKPIKHWVGFATIPPTILMHMFINVKNSEQREQLLQLNRWKLTKQPKEESGHHSLSIFPVSAEDTQDVDPIQ